MDGAYYEPTRFDLGELIDALDEFGAAKTVPVANKPTKVERKPSPFEFESFAQAQTAVKRFYAKPWDSK